MSPSSILRGKTRRKLTPRPRAAAGEERQYILCHYFGVIRLEEEGQGLAHGPLLLVVVLCLLIVQDEILQNLQGAVSHVVVERVHVKVVRASNVEMDALGKELALAGVRKLPDVVGVLVGGLVAEACLAAVALWLVFAPLLLLFFLVIVVVDGSERGAAYADKAVSRHGILRGHSVLGIEVGRAREGGPALASGNRRRACRVGAVGAIRGRTRLFGLAGASCRCAFGWHV